MEQMEAEMRTAIENKDVKSVELLLEKGVDPNLQYDDTNDDKLLNKTGELGGAQLVECLIHAGPSEEAINKFGETSGHRGACSTNSIDTNNEGKTPLHVAIDNKSPSAASASNPDCIKLLLKHGSDLGAVDRASGKSALIRIMKLPEGKKILREALDDCIQVQPVPDDEDKSKEQLSFNYSLLLTQEKTNKKKTNLIQMQLLHELIEDVSMDRTAQLIQHPVVESFLYLKWLKIRFFFLFSVLFYLALMIGVTVYTLLVFSSSNTAKNAAATVNSTPQSEETNETKKEKHSAANFIIDADLQLSLIVVIVAILIQEAIQMLSYPREYLRQTETWIKLVTLVSSSILIAVEMPWPLWVEHLSVLTFIFGWGEITLLISRFPVFGEYGLMFKLVTKQLAKFVFVFFFFLLGFALSFHIMFQNKGGDGTAGGYAAFSTPWSSLLRTLSMMVGDTIDFETYLIGKDSEAAPFKFYGTVHVVYFCFLILVPMILMNLIIGMAVSDIQALQIVGRVKQLRKQSTFIVDMEEAVSIISRWLESTKIESLKKCAKWLIKKISQPKTFTVDLKDTDKAAHSLPGGCLDRALAIKGLEENESTSKVTDTVMYNLLTTINTRIDDLKQNIAEKMVLEKNGE